MRKILLLLLAFITLFTSCDEFPVYVPTLPNIKPFVKGDTVSRTLLVYIMAENSISDALESDFNEIKRAAYEIPEDARLFVFFDNSDTISLPSLYQYHAYNGKLVENVVYRFDEDVCSSDTATLGIVFDAIFKDYPTESFDFVMGSHASGWIRQQNSAPNRTIGIDNGVNGTSNSTTATIEIEELACLLESLPVKVDRLVFDACLMQSVETAYALRNVANWIIGSPAEIPSYGAPYDKLVPLFFDSSAGVEDIMYEYKADYDEMRSGVVLSGIKTCYMQELADSTSKYVVEKMHADTTNYYMSCLAYVPGGVYSGKTKYPSYFDIVSVMKRVLTVKEYQSWRSVFDKAVPYVMVSNTISNTKRVWSQIANKYVEITGEHYGAVSAYIPQNKTQNSYFNEMFKTTEWYKAAGWEMAGW